MYTKEEDRRFKRKYIGILFQIETNYYIAPFSSYKPEKHDKMKDTIDFIKIGNKAIINLNNMFPVPLEVIQKVNIEKISEIGYKNLLRDEYKLCIPKFNKIIENSHILYKQVTIHDMPIKNRCCNFKLLEQKCQEYNKNRYTTEM
jgi:protein AbiQ